MRGGQYSSRRTEGPLAVRVAVVPVLCVSVSLCLCGTKRIVHRFFAPALDPGDETVLLPREEGEHLTRVLRLGVGDSVAVFDGRGNEWLARIASIIRRDVHVQLVSRVEAAA